MGFEQFFFDNRIKAGIHAAGYENPSPIQQQAMFPVLEGKDVLGLAQTGTGKTAAFALPLLQHLIDEDAPKKGPVRILVLAPTRELALQIQESFVTLGRQTGYRAAAVFGGVGFAPQIKAAQQASILVACPGRLLDLIGRKAVSLAEVHTLVLDEADRMFDMGFLPDLKRIIAHIPSKRQNLLFSATMPNEIRSLADDMLVDPVTIQVANTRPAESIKHAFYPVPHHLKSKLLLELLGEEKHDCVLVFTRTKHKAKTLAKNLERRGFAATSLQGNLSQSRRQEAMDGFRKGKYRVMVATEIAARGIDCARVTHVINFDMPDTPESYTHRIGRTGRADRSGTAITLLTSEDKSQAKLIERTLKVGIERCTLDSFDYSSQSSDTSPTEIRHTRGKRTHTSSAQARPERPKRKGYSTTKGSTENTTRSNEKPGKRTVAGQRTTHGSEPTFTKRAARPAGANAKHQGNTGGNQFLKRKPKPEAEDKDPFTEKTHQGSGRRKSAKPVVRSNRKRSSNFQGQSKPKAKR